MKQVVQPVSGGPVNVIEVPRPVIGPTEVLVQTVASIVSAGTERAVTALAQSSMLGKARARPDLVRQIISKARSEGVAQAARAIKARLADDLPLGYSACGIALEVGEAVPGVAPGQLVATGGAGKANHAEFQAVPALLCSAVPGGVPATDAAFATVASVALHGLRLAEVGPGSKVVVVGLGLLGQLGVRLAQAAGCDVAGIDVAELPVERARQAGALGLVESGADTTKAITKWSRGRGADAVLLMAATQSSAVAARATEICRDRASVVVVGDVGLELDRRPFYERELTLRFARSYGPGRHDRSYEEWGVDYPAGLVRWSEGRNQEAVLDLLAGGRLEVADLVTHRFTIANAAQAYRMVESQAEPFVGIAFDYPNAPSAEQPIILKPPQSNTAPGVGVIGAGAFASSVLIPAFKQAGFERFVAVASASGLSARRMAERAGFEKAVSGADAVIDDPDVNVVVIATPHETHADLTAQALRAGKHVFCEKPLALTMGQLDDVEAAWREGGGVLFVGFNRRYSGPIKLVNEHFVSGSGPLVITYRVSAGALPEMHWYHDRRQGGRLLGEVCHFIDTSNAIVGEKPSRVSALAATHGEVALAQDVVVTLAYPDGSLAAVTYASGGHQGTEKERIEIMGRGHSAVVVDFRDISLDGASIGFRRQDKGHVAVVAAFRDAMQYPTDAVFDGLSSSRAALEAAASLVQPGYPCP